MTERHETRWNGEFCQARRITAIVADDSRFPQYWARHLVGTRRQVVEVEYGGATFYLDNEDGSGWNKVTHGGSPHWGHSSLTIESASVQPCTHEDFDAVAADGDLRRMLADALTAEHHRRARQRIVDSPEGHSAAMADVAMRVLAINWRAEETKTQARRPLVRWHVEREDHDAWVPASPPNRPRESVIQTLAARRAEYPDHEFRLVRATTTYAVEPGTETEA